MDRKSQFKEKYWRDATEKDCGKLMIARFRDDPRDGWYYSILLRYGTVPDNISPGNEGWVSYADAGYEGGWAICQVYDPPKEKPQARQVIGRSVEATDWLLWEFTHDELKHYASTLGVPIGRNKAATINNLLEGGAQVRMTLGK